LLEDLTAEEGQMQIKARAGDDTPRHGWMWRLTAGLALAGILAGCTVSQALKTTPGTDLSLLQPGTPRSQVEALLGAPIKELKTKGGVRYRTYHFFEASKPSGTLALANAGLDVVTVGMWELVAEKSGYFDNRPRGQVLAVTYDDRDQVIDVFPDFNFIPELPADGRRSSLPPTPTR
jgi:hypothetical protein